ncbi:Asp23/Gls24 family envelope stress response protein [Gordonia sp. DT219]|uniref:Asp23/Gls24 family envelope stress response protein n=1 Tax=Gordonia sp. DT219 TaxID=3416658 RepID=UPI003CE8067E
MAESATASRSRVTVTRGARTHDPGVVGTAAQATGDAKGALVIADRVGAKIARRAALGIDGVIRHSNAIGSLLGPGSLGAAYPSVRVDMSDTAPQVEVTIALRWPCAVAQVCRDVRTHVADELARLTGIRPSRVDVTVATITTDSDDSGPRNGFIELPALPAGAPESAQSAGDTTTSDSAEEGIDS